MAPGIGTLSIVMLFVAAGLVMRALERRREALPGVMPAPEGAPLRELAVTADGERFLAEAHGVRILPAGDLLAMWPVRGRSGLDLDLFFLLRSTVVDPRTRTPVPSWVPGSRLLSGDLIGARLLAEAEGHQPHWRLEALGRDRDYRSWLFTEEDEARAALDMLQRRVVRRLPFDPGRWPPAADDYRRALEQRAGTERELASAVADWTWSVSRGGPWFTR